MVVTNSRSLLSVHAILYLSPVEAEEYDICKATSSSSSTEALPHKCMHNILLQSFVRTDLVNKA